VTMTVSTDICERSSGETAAVVTLRARMRRTSGRWCQKHAYERFGGVVPASGQIRHSCRSGAPEQRPDGKDRVGTLKEALLRRDHRIHAGDDPVNESDPSGDWIVTGTIGQKFSPTKAEAFVQALVTPAVRQVTFETELGNRRVDSYAILPDWLNEVKTGYVTNDASTDLQTAKDGLLLDARQGTVAYDAQSGGLVAGVVTPILGDTWWVLPNDPGGVSYMTGPQQNALTFDGINAIILKYQMDSNDSIFTSALGEAANQEDGTQIKSIFASQNVLACPGPTLP